MSRSAHQNTNDPSKQRLSTSIKIKLLAFTCAGFLTIMTETIPAGLLPQISHALHITYAQTGQLISAYALGSVIAAIPIITWTQTWNRRPLLLAAIFGLMFFNALTALSTHYLFALVVRFMAGISAGVIWGLLAGYARRLVTNNLQGKALALAGVGQPLALCFGVPLGTWLGSILGWQNVFWMMSFCAATLLIWIRIDIPDFHGQQPPHKNSIYQVFNIQGISAILMVLFFWILAHNILYTYISPFLQPYGLNQHLDLVLMLFGFSSIIGIWFTGMWVDQYLRKITLYSLALFAFSMLILCFISHSAVVALLAIAMWGITFGGAPTLLQTALADSAGDHTDIAQSMLVTVFNLAVAAGGILGGFLLDHYSIFSFPWVIFFIVMIALSIVYCAKNHGFKQGARSQN